ncbi:hypothetical protein RINTHM_4270 [Richelia intracellularis HM01]|nr:hypothetical protein RINTHM_4270 [Richelia intracellularis HM01]
MPAFLQLKNQLDLSQQQQPVVSKVFPQSRHLLEASYHVDLANLSL